MSTVDFPWQVWTTRQMALDKIQARLQRITAALGSAGVPYAVVGGHAVASWVSMRDPAAVRTTKDVNLLVQRDHLPQIQAAAATCDLSYTEVLGVAMLVERSNPNPKEAVHLIWAGEKVRAEHLFPPPSLDDREELSSNMTVLGLLPLIRMKLQSGRNRDLTHIEDMIEVGLIDRSILSQLPQELAKVLEPLLKTAEKEKPF
jgi:hypothetical protein